jgi:hypothetical protein
MMKQIFQAVAFAMFLFSLSNAHAAPDKNMDNCVVVPILGFPCMHVTPSPRETNSESMTNSASSDTTPVQTQNFSFNSFSQNTCEYDEVTKSVSRECEYHDRDGNVTEMVINGGTSSNHENYSAKDYETKIQSQKENIASLKAANALLMMVNGDYEHILSNLSDRPVYKEHHYIDNSFSGVAFFVGILLGLLACLMFQFINRYVNGKN